MRVVAKIAEIVVRLVVVGLGLLLVPLYVALYLVLHLFGLSTEKASPSPFPDPADPEGARYAEVVAKARVELYNRPLWYERANSLAFPALHIAFAIALCLQVFAP